MTTATITKTLNKANLKDSSMSLGFRRYIVLPTRVKRNIQSAHLIATGNTNTHNAVVGFFEGMTEQEYITYLKQS